jgi:hypothetical protein
MYLIRRHAEDRERGGICPVQQCLEEESADTLALRCLRHDHVVKCQVRRRRHPLDLPVLLAERARQDGVEALPQVIPLFVLLGPLFRGERRRRRGAEGTRHGEAHDAKDAAACDRHGFDVVFVLRCVFQKEYRLAGRVLCWTSSYPFEVSHKEYLPSRFSSVFAQSGN